MSIRSSGDVHPPTRRRAFLLGIAAAGVASAFGTEPAAAALAPRRESCADDVHAESLDAAVQALPPGSTLRVTRSWTRDRTLVLDEPVTLLFEGAGAIRMTGGRPAVEIKSSGVAVVGGTIVGPGAVAGTAAHGILASGTVTAPLRDIRIVDVRVREFGNCGVRLEHVDGFAVVGCTIGPIGYAGVMALSASDGLIRDNDVADIVQPDPYVNSYGIIVSRNDAVSLADAPRSARVTIDQNRIRGVRWWEGIDTYSGDDVVIRDNVVEGCRVGIAVVPSKDATTRHYAIASHDVVVTGNRVTAAAGGPTGSGIIVKGAGTTVGDDVDRATAIVSGNRVVGHGGGTNEAAILAYFTTGLVLVGNHIEDANRAAVSLFHSNRDVTVSRTTIAGLLRPSGARPTAGIELAGAASDARVLVTNLLASAEHGLVCGAGSEATLIGNDWGGARKVLGGSGAAAVRRFGEEL